MFVLYEGKLYYFLRRDHKYISCDLYQNRSAIQQPYNDNTYKDQEQHKTT